LLCNNNEITACIADLARFIADLSNGFCKEVYVCDVYVGGKVRVSEFMIFLDLQHCGSK